MIFDYKMKNALLMWKFLNANQELHQKGVLISH